MKSDVIHCKNCDIIALNGKVVETKPESYMKLFRGNSVANELVKKVIDLRQFAFANTPLSRVDLSVDDFKELINQQEKLIRQQICDRLRAFICNNDYSEENEAKQSSESVVYTKQLYEFLDKVEKGDINGI